MAKSMLSLGKDYLLFRMKSGCLLFLLTAGSFYCYLCYTVIAPFIPGEIARRGLSQVHNGIIIA